MGYSRVMPKFYCEYCNIYLTHSSPAGRKQHSQGKKHINAKIEYYQNVIRERGFQFHNAPPPGLPFPIPPGLPFPPPFPPPAGMPMMMPFPMMVPNGPGGLPPFPIPGTLPPGIPPMPPTGQANPPQPPVPPANSIGIPFAPPGVPPPPTVEGMPIPPPPEDPPT